MIVAGVMSGTSADGIDVALVRMTEPARSKTHNPKLELLGHLHFGYPERVRKAVLVAMNSPAASVADLARLNVLLGHFYGEAVLATQTRFRRKADLVGCHGQTLYHQGSPVAYIGRKLTTTWQTGEGAVIAARVGVPVVSDFRPADMAAGGKGAPLVPFLDALFYRDAHLGRIAQNIGGIANLTSIPRRAPLAKIRAFDTGPGNMLIDALTEALFHRHYDQNGTFAAAGRVLKPVLREFLALPFFRQRPPKTAGREQFGREFAAHFLRGCGRAAKHDILATATALTAHSIADAIRRFVLSDGDFAELIVSGGGAHNATLLAMLANQIAPLGLTLRLSDEFGLPSEAKEAVAFALLAYQTWHRRPSNVPRATGARKPAILGKISYA